MTNVLKKISIRYFAVFREARGLSEEALETTANTLGELYDELSRRYHFHLDKTVVRAAINDAFDSWETPLNANDRVVFLPPVAGG